VARVWYQVRVREETSPHKWIKKSKFFFARNPSDAAGKYRGNGNVMWVEKVPKERLLGIGEFFKLGDKLLGELREQDYERG
jgi:hypothetical protein